MIIFTSCWCQCLLGEQLAAKARLQRVDSGRCKIATGGWTAWKAHRRGQQSQESQGHDSRAQSCKQRCWFKRSCLQHVWKGWATERDRHHGDSIKLAKSFSVADASSSFFGDQSQVQIRSLTRHLSAVALSLSSADLPEGGEEQTTLLGGLERCSRGASMALSLWAPD